MEAYTGGVHKGRLLHNTAKHNRGMGRVTWMNGVSWEFGCFAGVAFNEGASKANGGNYKGFWTAQEGGFKK